MSTEIITKLGELFPIEQAEPIELRAIKGRSVRSVIFNAVRFPDADERRAAFFASALQLNDQGYNIYAPFNAVSPDFSGQAVKDCDIVRRRWLLVDLDRAGDTKNPATDDEIKDAEAVADRIADWFRSFGDGEPLRVMSGNGIHLYFPIDLPNDKPSKELCQGLLQNLAREFDTNTVKVDLTVHSAGQITKVPGTIARKGIEGPDRPYRRAVFR